MSTPHIDFTLALTYIFGKSAHFLRAVPDFVESCLSLALLPFLAGVFISLGKAKKVLDFFVGTTTGLTDDVPSYVDSTY